jgi:hypothetical protein
MSSQAVEDAAGMIHHIQGELPLQYGLAWCKLLPYNSYHGLEKRYPSLGAYLCIKSTTLPYKLHGSSPSLCGYKMTDRCFSVPITWSPTVCLHANPSHVAKVFAAIIFLCLVSQCLARRPVEQPYLGTWRDLFGIRTAWPLIHTLLRDGNVYFLV